jgi:glutathione S-transferase
MLKLLIGNKNYSSWSLRPWLLLAHAQIPFEEELISFNADDFGARVGRYSPVRKVPVLVHDDVVVWDSLAICEYVAETFPDRALWPAERKARAHARSLCAEMHSSFGALRGNLVMNFQTTFPRTFWPVAVQKDIARILAMWTDCLDRYGGPFLFGAFSVADAYFAPVTRRFVTYDVQVPPRVGAFMQTITELPAMGRWTAAALAERDFVPEDEPYRTAP